MPLNLNLPAKKGLFITGTDTSVGKTLIAGAIAKILTDQNHKVGVFKPIATGCRKDRNGLISSDTEFLAFCSNSEFPLSVINPVTYQIPAAPIVCEKREKNKIDFEHIASIYKYICENSDIVIVEGIGGVRVPLTDNVDLLALAKEFNLPTIIVARPNLGTINHTLLTIDAVRSAGLHLAGVIITGLDVLNEDIAEITAPRTIADCANTPILSIVPLDEESDIEKALLGQTVLEELAEFDWAKLASR